MSKYSIFEIPHLFTDSHSASDNATHRSFLNADTIEQQIKYFAVLAKLESDIDAKTLIRMINNLIVKIDEAMNQQVNAILHHSRFQQIEASWRGLLYLTLEAESHDNIKIKFLDVSWAHLVKDLDRAIDFDQSNLFRKIYNNEFGVAGGEPFGVILGDYYMRHRPSAEHKTDDISALREISQIAASAFTPFITGADPVMFGLDSFAGLATPINFENIFSQKEYLKWNTLRKSEDTRFIGLVLPHILMRKPYEYDSYRSDGFYFKEDVSNPNNKGYLWGNASYAFGAVLIKSFANNGWFTDIRGSHNGVDRGGVVPHLPVLDFKTDSKSVALKYTTDVLISDTVEKIMSELGFIALSQSKDTPHAVFYGNQSIQGEQQYDKKIAEVNAKISAMLQYVLCVSRFAHYIKIIGREKVGSFFSAEECEEYLHKWLLQYATGSSSGTEEHLAKYPLAEARVEVKEIPGKPGAYACVAHLKPHTQLDQMVSAVKLVTELAEAKV